MFLTFLIFKWENFFTQNSILRTCLNYFLQCFENILGKIENINKILKTFILYINVKWFQKKWFKQNLISEEKCFLYLSMKQNHIHGYS